MLVLGIATQGAQALGPVGAPVDRPVPLEHVVQPGDSLWSIAVRIADGRDPRAVVDAIQRANGLSGGAIVPGQLLRLPIDA